MNENLNDNNNYQKFKAEATDKTFLRKKVLLANIKVTNKPNADGANYFLTYDDGARKAEIKMDTAALKSLIKLLGLSITVMDSFTEAIGAKAAENLLDLMRRALQGKEGRNMVTLIVDTRTKNIVNIQREDSSILSNNAFFHLFEEVMNSHPTMKIKNMAFTDGGSLTISVVNSNWEFNIGGLKEEYFHSGLTFIQTHNATIITPFNERLTCTNGMVITENSASIKLVNSSAEHINGFFAAVREIKDMKFFEQTFKRRVVLMMNTVASVSELRKAHHTLTDEFDLNDPHTRSKIESSLGYDYVAKSYMNHRIDIIQADENLRKKYRTDKTVWDLVNVMTDLSSHTSQYYLQFRNSTDRDSSIFRVQRAAGEICYKNPYDLQHENLINPFDSPVKQESIDLINNNNL